MRNLHKISATFILALTIALTISCDEITPPYKHSNPPPPPDSGMKKVLLEDYTGFRCGNCPRAHDIATDISQLYGDRVIVLAVHAGAHAITTGSRTYNFVTPEGNEIDRHFGIGWGAGTPNGMVDREFFDGQRIIAPESWEVRVRQQLETKPKMKISITPSYNDQTREIKATINIEYLEASSSNDHLAVYFVEDSIIQYQLDDRYKENPHILDYVHMHVLRGSMNGAWGEQLSSADISAGAKFEKSYTFTIPPNKDWKPKDMKLIAYIHDHQNTYQIWQAEEVKLINK